jgi:hypothetical protein
VPFDARGLVLTDLIGRLARSVMEGAGRYEAAARQAEGALRQALEALGRAKRAQVAELAPLARGLGAPAPLGEAEPSPAPPPAWGRILAEAFQGERALERTARELAALAPDAPLRALAARLARGAAEQGREVRRLYLQYS